MLLRSEGSGDPSPPANTTVHAKLDAARARGRAPRVGARPVFTGKKGDKMRHSSPRRGAGREKRRRGGRDGYSARGGAVVLGAGTRLAVVQRPKQKTPRRS